jgi:hypothetical protein
MSSSQDHLTVTDSAAIPHNGICKSCFVYKLLNLLASTHHHPCGDISSQTMLEIKSIISKAVLEMKNKSDDNDGKELVAYVASELARKSG